MIVGGRGDEKGLRRKGERVIIVSLFFYKIFLFDKIDSICLFLFI